MKLSKLLMTAGLLLLFVSSIALSQAQDSGQPGTAQKPVVKQSDDPNVKKPTRRPPTPPPQATAGKVKSSNKAPEVKLANSRISFDHNVFDFGVVPGGAQLTHHFPVKNIGTDTLIITQIKAG